jgi:hypothetical protein
VRTEAKDLRQNDISSTLSLYPVRKPHHFYWGWWKYLQKQEHQVFIEGVVKALSFLTGFTSI